MDGRGGRAGRAGGCRGHRRPACRPEDVQRKGAAQRHARRLPAGRHGSAGAPDRRAMGAAAAGRRSAARVRRRRRPAARPRRRRPISASLLLLTIPPLWLLVRLAPTGPAADRAVRLWCRLILALSGCSLRLEGETHLHRRRGPGHPGREPRELSRRRRPPRRAAAPLPVRRQARAGPGSAGGPRDPQGRTLDGGAGPGRAQRRRRRAHHPGAPGRPVGAGLSGGHVRAGAGDPAVPPGWLQGGGGHRPPGRPGDDPRSS